MINEFIELSPFTKAAESLLGLEGLRLLQAALIKDPEAGDVIPGGRGLRKVRVALPGRGKRGGARVIYYLHTPEGQCFLLAIYAKNEAESLTKAEVRELSKIVAVLTS
jgi:hypothetical protein